MKIAHWLAVSTPVGSTKQYVPIPDIPERYSVKVSKARIKSDPEGSRALAEEGAVLLRRVSVKGQGSDAQTYVQCMALVNQAKERMRGGLAENAASFYEGGASQADFLDKLGECHMLAKPLPAFFRARICQGETDVASIAIEVMDKILDSFVDDVLESRPEKYLLMSDWRARTISFYQRELAGFIVEQPVFAERDVRVDFETMLAKAAERSEAHPYGWNEFVFFAQEALVLDEDAAKARIVAAREPTLRALWDGRKSWQTWELRTEAESLGIVLEGMEGESVSGRSDVGGEKRPVLDDATLSGWEQGWSDGSADFIQLLFDIQQFRIDGADESVRMRFVSLADDIVRRAVGEFGTWENFYSFGLALRQIAPLLPYVGDATFVVDGFRDVCGTFFDGQSAAVLNFDVRAMGAVERQVFAENLERFVNLLLMVQEDAREVFPGLLILDDDRQARLAEAVMRLGESASNRTDFETWAMAAQEAQALAPGLSSRIQGVMQERGLSPAIVVAETHGEEIPLPEDWGEIMALARQYVSTLWSYPQAGRTGYNLLYGPLCDVARRDSPGYMENAGRIFAHDPEVAAALALLTVRAAHGQNTRLGFVLKHAPGIGEIGVNPEWGKLTVDYRSKEAVLAEFSAFERAFSSEEGTAVMVSGVAYPSLEDAPTTLKPAALSPAVCGLIRESLGPDAVLFSDDLGTPAFQDYFKKQGVKPDSMGLYVVPGVLAATQAGVDVCLTYVRSVAGLKMMLDELEKSTLAGTVTRATLEESVLRILKYKRRLFPDAPVLADPEALVKKMSVRDLWAQKIVYPSFSVSDSKAFLGMGVGGITFEGIQHPSYYMDLVARETTANPGLIPPFLANNSPQELGDKTSSASADRARERDLLRDLAGRLEKDYPDGVPPEIADRLVEAAFGE